jgi:hypothetical protein
MSIRPATLATVLLVAGMCLLAVISWELASLGGRCRFWEPFRPPRLGILLLPCPKSPGDPCSGRRMALRPVRWFRWYEPRAEVLD